MPTAPAPSRRTILSAVSLTLALLASLVGFAVASPADATVKVDDECYVEMHTYTKYVRSKKWVGYTSWSVYDYNGPLPGGTYHQGPTSNPGPYLDSGGNVIGSEGLPHGKDALGRDRFYRYQITKTVKDAFPCPDASATPGTCEAPGAITPSSSEHYEWEIEGDTVTFSPIPPAKFGASVQTVFTFPEIEQLPPEDCVDTWTLKVEKELDDPEGVVSAGTLFDISIECVDGEDVVVYSGTESIEAGGVATFSGIPEDAECTISEDDPEGGLPSSWSWDAPVYPQGTMASYQDCFVVTIDQVAAVSDQSGCTVWRSVLNTPSEDDTPPPRTPPPPPGDDTPDEVRGIVVEADPDPEPEPVVESIQEEAAAPAVLPRTGGEAGAYLIVASLLMGLGATFRTVSRRFS